MNRKGFTLIELLVVIFIFGLLSTLVVVGMNSAKEQKADAATRQSTDIGVTVPAPGNYLVDESGVLTESQKNLLNSKLKMLDTKDHQYGVLLVKTTNGVHIDEYSIRAAEKWKVGHAGLDNGAMIVIATDDRKWRIEVGTGLESKISDTAAGIIGREVMVPFLKDGKWYEAIDAGLTAINSRAQ